MKQDSQAAQHQAHTPGALSQGHPEGAIPCSFFQDVYRVQRSTLIWVVLSVGVPFRVLFTRVSLNPKSPNP